MTKIKFQKNHIKEFEKLGIETIYLFGSQAEDKAHKMSDFDFGVVLRNYKEYKHKTLNIYSRLYDILTDVLPAKYLHRRFKTKAHELDIVFLQSAPISLQFEASQKGIVIYQIDEQKTFQYKENILKRFLDFKYFYDLAYKNLLARI